MAMKLSSAKKEMTGDHMWKKFEDWWKEIFMQYTSKLPTDFTSTPSGHQLRDIYNKFIVD
jgi:hypothetical protein